MTSAESQYHKFQCGAAAERLRNVASGLRKAGDFSRR